MLVNYVLHQGFNVLLPDELNELQHTCMQPSIMMNGVDDDNNQNNNGNNSNTTTTFQLMVSWVRAGQVLSLQSSLSLCIFIKLDA